MEKREQEEQEIPQAQSSNIMTGRAVGKDQEMMAQARADQREEAAAKDVVMREVNETQAPDQQQTSGEVPEAGKHSGDGRGASANVEQQ